MMGTGDEAYKRLKRPLVPFNAVATSDGNAGGTTLVASGLANKGTGNDFFNNFRIVLTSGANTGWMADIVDYVAATGTFTINPALGVAIVAGTRFGLVAKWSLYNWILTGYDSSAINSDDDGSVMERLEYIQEALKPFDIAWIFSNLLIDADQFDIPSADADTERWTPEYITGADEAAADIDTTTTDKLYMKIDSTGVGAREYAVGRELPILMRHFAFQGDVDFTWGTVTATAMRGGILISKSAAYDVQNMVRVYKEKSTGVERVVADAWFNNVAQTAAQIDTTDDVLAFRIERNGNIYRCYYSVEQGDDIVWMLITQFEDPSEFMTETVSCYYDIYSVGSAATEDIQIDVDNFYLYNTFGAFADRIGNPLETSSGPGAAGSLHSKIRGIMLSLGIVIPAGTGFEADGSGTTLYEALVGVTEDTGAAGWLSGAAHESLADMPSMTAVLQGMPSPHVDQDSIRVAQLSVENLRTDATLAPVGERTGTVISIERFRIGVDADWNAIATPGVTEAAGYDWCAYTFPIASWQNGDLIRYRAHSCVFTIGAAARQTFYVPELVVYGVVGGIAAIMAKLDLLQEVFWMADWDIFDIGDATPVSSVRWEGENYVDDAEDSDASIAAGVATVIADPDVGTPTSTGYWLRHKPVRVSRHFSAIVDLDSTLVENTGETLAGLMLTKGAAYDADNYLYVARRKNLTGSVDDVVSDGVIGTAAQTESTAAITADAVALRIDRNGNIIRLYASLTQAPTYEWILIGEFQDAANAFGGDTSVALFAHSAAADADHTAQGVFDNFKYYVNISGLVEIQAGDYESAHVVADRDGSLAERLEYITEEQIGNEFDGSPDLYDTVVSGYDATALAGNAKGSILEALQVLQGLVYVGFCDAGMAASLTVISCGGIMGYGDDYFNTDYAIVVIRNDNNHGVAPEGEARDITDYTDAGVFTTAAFSANVEEADIIMVIRRELLLVDAAALKTTPITDSLAYRISQFVATGDGDFAGSTPLPSNISLFDILCRLGDPAFPAAAKAANDVSLAEVLRYVSDEQIGEEFDGAPDIYDTIVSGYTTAAATTPVGSVLERLQVLQQSSILKNTIWTASASSTTTLTAAALLDVAGAYVGQIAIPLAGNMEGHGRYITAYDGTQIITVTPPWAADPGLVDFIIVPSEASIVYEAIAGAAGILAWAGAAVPGANVSLHEVIQYIYSEQFGTEFDGSPDLYDAIITGWTGAATATAVGALIERLQLLQQALINNNTIFTSSAATVNTVTCAALVDRDDLYVGMMLVPMTGNQAGQGRYITAYDDTAVLTVVPDWSTDPDAAGAFTFVVMPTPMKFAYEAGKGLSAIYDLVNGLPVLTRIYSDYDIGVLTVEETVFEYDDAAYVWHPHWLSIHLDEIAAAEQLEVKIYVKDNDTDNNERLMMHLDYLGVQAVPVKFIELPPVDLYFKVTVEQTGGALRDVIFKLFKES